MHTFSPMGNIKYLYMSRTQRHIKSQFNTINEVSNAIIQKPTNAAFVSKEIMETHKEKRNLRQTGKIVYFKSTLAENTKTKRQKKTESVNKIMENENSIDVRFCQEQEIAEKEKISLIFKGTFSHKLN